MMRYALAATAALWTTNTAIAASVMTLPLPPGISPQSAFTFSFLPEINFGDAENAAGPVQGYIENAVIGDNTSFELAATVTSAGDATALGSGYMLLYLVGSDPAFRISSSGKITFANAIFSRGGGQTLTLVTPGSTAFSNSLFSDNGGSFSYQEASIKPATFGSITAAVPEPRSWALMLIGFGTVGWSLRRRQRASSVLPSC